MLESRNSPVHSSRLGKPLRIVTCLFFFFSSSLPFMAAVGVLVGRRGRLVDGVEGVWGLGCMNAGSSMGLS